MLKTEHRPAPLPPRPTSGPVPSARLPLPEGAARWSKAWLDADGIPQQSEYPVPVDADDRRTLHVRHACPGHIEIGGEKLPCDQTKWVAPGEAAGFCKDHGAELKPETKTRSGVPWAKVWDRADERIRVTGVGVAVGIAGFALDAAELPWWGDVLELASLPAVVASSWWLTRWWLTRKAIKDNKIDPDDEVAGKRRRKRIAKQARIGGYDATGAVTWVAFADLLGIIPENGDGKALLAALLGGLAGATIVGGKPYLRHVDSRRAAKPVEVVAEVQSEVVADVNAEAEQDAADWAATVAVSGGLPGTYVDVSTWRADPGGRRLVVRNRGRGGALTEERLRQALPLMAGAFDVSRSAIGWIEEYDGSPNAVELLVQPNSPLNEVIPGEPIDIVDINKAVVHMGRRIDGTPLVTRMFTPGWGSPSRAIFGTKGSGKTELIRRLLLAQLRTRVMGPERPVRLVAPFLHDPKRGADYGAFRRQVSGFSVDSSTLHMIVDAFGREMDRRYDALAGVVWKDSKGRWREGEKPFDPRVMGAILSLDMDEFHVDAKDQLLMTKLDPFARKMRAAGIEINIATHAATIGDTGSQGFRDMLAGGEAWLLRTTMGLNAALATGGTLTGDPRLLPRVPGMVLQSSGEDTTMQARIAYDDGEAMYDMLYDDDNNSRIQPIKWLPETLEAFGPDFVQWMRDSQERPIGSIAVSAPATYKPAGAAPEQTDDRKAFDVLLLILKDGGKPMKRSDIVNDARWTWATKTLTNVLRAGQDVDPQLVRKIEGSNGAYELTEAGLAWGDLDRERREAAQAESAAESAEAGQ